MKFFASLRMTRQGNGRFCHSLLVVAGEKAMSLGSWPSGRMGRIPVVSGKVIETKAVRSQFLIG